MPKRNSSAATATSLELRRDIYVYNDATGFLITSKGMQGKGFDSLSSKWSSAVKKGQIIPIELYQDDPFVVRVVLNSKLSEAEESEWLGKFVHKLSVKDGRVVVAGGVEFVEEPSDGDDDENDYLAVVDVPAGDYRAEIYTYVNSVNADALLERADKKQEEIGAYFRRTRKRTDFPSWLKFICSAYPDRDPGHENEWADKPIPEVPPYISVLIRLTLLDKEIDVTASLSQGFYGPDDFECRKPDKCPLGLEGEDVAQLPGSHQAGVQAPPPVVGVDIGALLKQTELTSLEKTIDVPLEDIFHCYLLSWYSASGSHPELIIELPGGASSDNLIEALTLPNQQILRSSDQEVCLRWPSAYGRWEMLGHMRMLNRKLSELGLPDGSNLEMRISNEPAAGANAKASAGEIEVIHRRWRGKVHGGVWHIGQISPDTKPGLAEEALALAAAAAGGKAIAVSNSVAAELALRYFYAQFGGVSKPGSLTLADGKIHCLGDDKSALHLVAANYFKEHYRDVWKVQAVEQSVREVAARIELQEKLSKQILFSGENGRVFTASSVNTLDADAVNAFKKFEADVLAIKGSAIGELARSQFNKFMFAYFSMPDGHSRIVWYRGGMPVPFIDIISDFEDGASLATTMRGGPGDDPAKMIFQTRCPNTPLAELYAKHVERCALLRTEHGALKSFDGTLLECARRFEDGIKRQS